MSASIADIEPVEIQAGDTLKFNKSLSDYSAADGWTLTYYLVGAAQQSFVATASGSNFAVSVSAATTAGWAAGIYKLSGFVSKAGERFEVYSGSVEVLANAATQTGAVECRSNARIILDALIATEKRAAARPEQMYRMEAAGREFRFYSHADLITAISHWQSIVTREEMEERLARGENSGRDILVRFR
jgi:hypothetical protein